MEQENRDPSETGLPVERPQELIRNQVSELERRGYELARAGDTKAALAMFIAVAELVKW